MGLFVDLVGVRGSVLIFKRNWALGIDTRIAQVEGR